MESKNERIAEILQKKLIVIVRGLPRQQLRKTAQALYDGGIRFLESTDSASGAVTDGQTAESIAMLTDAFGTSMHIGAGTVLTEEQVRLTREAGGEFIISPDTNEAVIRRSVELGLVSIPGALTPTEIQRAHQAGADFVKLFPVVSMGVDYVRAVCAPLSHIRLLAVGGVHLGNLRDYLRAGVCGFGIGTNIIDRACIERGDYAGITRLASEYTAVIGNAE